MGQREVCQLRPGHQTGSNFCNRVTGRLGYKRHGAATAWIYLQEIDLLILDCELDIHEPNDIQRIRKRSCLSLYGVQNKCRQMLWWQDAGAVP